MLPIFSILMSASLIYSASALTKSMFSVVTNNVHVAKNGMEPFHSSPYLICMQHVKMRTTCFFTGFL